MNKPPIFYLQNSILKTPTKQVGKQLGKYYLSTRNTNT